MGLYKVEVIITYRKELRDPESEIIHKDLILKKGYASVKKVTTGKYFSMLVESDTKENAISTVRELCEKLRIYNPIAQEIEVFVRE
ncbi:MAG: phosphoribosylformylglycinamidine synthase subunit PurS [Fervidicoccus fontis]